MKQLLVSGLLAMTLFLPVAQAVDGTTTKFKDYAVSEIYQERAVRLLQNSEPRFEYELLQALGSPVNFAGEYAVAKWGCGSSCETGAVVSKKTGKWVMFPGGIYADPDGTGKSTYTGQNLYTRANSRLFIMVGLTGGDETNNIFGAHFYEFTGSAFKHIKSVAGTPFSPAD
ncbi:hypothetical protein [Leucothrix mucor]|uniref:hypothetical protein n=1 Tax=Leucothrix mucor TaxID=45248 RepID=UPI0003B492B4|nr:hypothetical protein [Leucothrix mucor]